MRFFNVYYYIICTHCEKNGYPLSKLRSEKTPTPLLSNWYMTFQALEDVLLGGVKYNFYPYLNIY